MKKKLKELDLNIDQSINTITFNDQEINIRSYLPIKDKIDILERVINNSSDQLQFYNSSKLDMFLDLEILFNYTDIEFEDDDKEDLPHLYDLVSSSGLLNEVLDAMAASEVAWLQEHLYETVKAIYEYNHSILGIMDTITRDYSNLGGEITELQEKISDPKNLTLLKDIVTKLG